MSSDGSSADGDVGRGVEEGVEDVNGGSVEVTEGGVVTTVVGFKGVTCHGF